MNVLFKLTLFLFAFSAINVCAQNNNSYFPDTTRQFNISLGADYTYGSPVMNTNFFNKFIFGGEIEKKDKDNAFKNLSKNNRFGGDLNYSANAEIPLKKFLGKNNLSFKIGFELIEHLDANFTSDLFKFAYGGNKQFAGQAIDLSDVNFNYFKYEQLNLGLIRYKKKNDVLVKDGAIISLIMGEDQKSVSVERGSIFTEQFGREIELDLNYLYNSSDTSKTGFGTFNGLGVSVDLFKEFSLKNGDKIFVRIDDIGFINWNKNALEIGTDSSFHFEGIFINNIFDLNDTLLNNLSQDSIISSLSTINKKDKHTIYLPTSFNLNYTKVFNPKLKINVGIYYKMMSNYFPLIYSNYYYYINKKLVVKAHLSYGGYGKLNTGLAVAKSFSKYVNVFIGTNNIEAFIAPNSSYNNSGFIGVKAYF